MNIDDAIFLLTKMMLEEKFGKDRKIVINKTSLYQFCIKLLKVVERGGL